MRLISCYIDNFGLLKETKIDFKRGLNCFSSLNGTGKTTLTVFIKAMLYGFGDNRASKEENERKKYNPWQGGRYGGSMTFEAGGKTYTAERTFGNKVAEDTFILRDATTGGVSNIYTENLGEELFGIDRDGFIRTVFLSERSIAASARISGSVASRLSDIMGADGDVGNYKRAMALLDERRKLYQKRGGGEIEHIRAQIAEYDRRLDALDRLSAEAAEKDASLRAVNEKIAALTKKREALDARLAEISGIKERRRYRVTYDEMLDELRREEEALGELSRFFGGVIPSNEEIEAARAAKLESDMILAELGRSEADAELIRLTELFAPLSGIAELDEADMTAKALVEDTARLALIRNGEDERSKEMRELFPAKLPSSEELEGAITRAKAGGGALPTVLLAIGAVIIAAGVALGFVSSTLFALCALGAVLAVTGPVVGAIKKGRALAEARSFLYEIQPEYSGDVLGKLYEKKKDLERYERLRELREAEERALREKIDTGRRVLDNFFAKFGVRTEDYAMALRLIRQEYQRYTMLSMSEEHSAGSRTAKLARGKELAAKAKTFVARYPTVTDEPFGEIKNKASDYLFRSQRVTKLREQAENFARVYGITENPEKYDEAEEIGINQEIAGIDSELISLRREAAVLARQHADLVNEIETSDDIEAAKAVAVDNLAAAQRSYENVRLAMAILEEAYNNMTSRYTGKTRERFLYYMGKISGTEGEYLLDTEFEITKIERGVARDEDAYSRGTKDLYSLAMRLALTDSLYDGELPFLVLDDPFIALDDEKCKRAKEMLRNIAEERQILYFTCSDSRAI